jgi:hypothetical protein
MFNQELTPVGPRPNLILFDPLHCYKKFIHAVGDHHWPRKNIRLVRTEPIDRRQGFIVDPQRTSGQPFLPKNL